MEHSCHKCGQAIEDGVPFCSHCGAPQIRVTIEPIEAAVAPAGSAVLAQDTALAPGPPALSAFSVPVQWDHAVPACAIAGLAAALLMCLGLMVPLLAMLGGGLLAVVLYRRRTLGVLVKGWTGAQLGALSGLFSFGMAAIFEAVAVAFFRSGAQIRQKILEAIQQAASRTSDPQAQVIFDYFKSPPGMAVMMIFFLIFALLSFVVLGAIGGAIGGTLFGARNRS